MFQQITDILKPWPPVNQGGFHNVQVSSLDNIYLRLIISRDVHLSGLKSKESHGGSRLHFVSFSVPLSARFQKILPRRHFHPHCTCRSRGPSMLHWFEDGVPNNPPNIACEGVSCYNSYMNQPLTLQRQLLSIPSAQSIYVLGCTFVGVDLAVRAGEKGYFDDGVVHALNIVLLPSMLFGAAMMGEYWVTNLPLQVRITVHSFLVLRSARSLNFLHAA